MTTTINDNQNPIEAAITHFIKETGNTAIKGYFELNPIVYNDHTNKIVVLYTTSSDTYNKDYGWTNSDNIDDLFIPGNDYVITDPIIYTAMLLTKEYSILEGNEDLVDVPYNDFTEGSRLYTIEEANERIDGQYISDYDGDGSLLRQDKNGNWFKSRLTVSTNYPIPPYAKEHYTHFIWFNK